AEPPRRLVHVERSHHVGLERLLVRDHTVAGNAREVNDGIAAGQGAADLSEIADIAGDALDPVGRRPRRLIEDGDLVNLSAAFRARELTHDPATGLAQPSGHHDLHAAQDLVQRDWFTKISL